MTVTACACMNRTLNPDTLNRRFDGQPRLVTGNIVSGIADALRMEHQMRTRHRREDWGTSAPHPWVLLDMAVETNSRRSAAAVSLMAVKRCLGMRLLAQSTNGEAVSCSTGPMEDTDTRANVSCNAPQRLCDEARGCGDGVLRLPGMSHCTAFVAHDEYARLCCEGMRWPGVRLQ
jgi:hypothetical protein